MNNRQLEAAADYGCNWSHVPIPVLKTGSASMSVTNAISFAASSIVMCGTSSDLLLSVIEINDDPITLPLSYF